MIFYENEYVSLYHDDYRDVISNLKYDLVVTDPPYEFISKNPLGGGIMQANNKKHLEAIKDSFGMSFNPQEFLEIIKPGFKNQANMYIFTNKSLLAKYIEYSEQNKFKWEILVMLKNNPIPCFNGHYMIDKEYCLYIKKPGAYFNSKNNYLNYFTYYLHNIGNNETKHPTEKPVEIIDRMVLNSSKENDIILDPFAGSGTTALSCIQHKRHCILIEKNEEYCKIIKNRLEKDTKSLFED